MHMPKYPQVTLIARWLYFRGGCNARCACYLQLYTHMFVAPDYAVQIFHDALATGHHTCYLRPDTRLPMMYIHDCLRAIMEFLDIPEPSLRQRTYNIQAMSFTPAELTQEIQKVIPEFTISYSPDTRQQIGMAVSMFV